jgi:sulfate permease, SulP family
MSATAASEGSRWRGIIPAARWLRSYDPAWLRGDVAAGVTLSAYLLLAALGDAALAGLPSEAGLYASLFGGLVFWLFCSSRQASTVTSAISLLIGSSFGALAGGYSALAACTALLVALIAWLARAGSAVNFISESVMTGFKAGVALHLASTQLPKLFGVKGGHGDFWERMHVSMLAGYAGMHRVRTGLSMVAIGAALVALTIALGG